MNIELSGAQIIGFLVIVAAIGPGLICVGMFVARVRALETWRKKQEPLEERFLKVEADTLVLMESREAFFKKIDTMNDTLQRLLGRTESAHVSVEQKQAQVEGKER